MTLFQTAPDGRDFRLLIRPDCSLSPSGVRAIVLIFSLVAFLIGGFMLILGAWPVLPFLGLEVAVLVVVFLMLQRRSTFYDLVEARGDHVSLRQRSQYGETAGTLQNTGLLDTGYSQPDRVPPDRVRQLLRTAFHQAPV